MYKRSYSAYRTGQSKAIVPKSRVPLKKRRMTPTPLQRGYLRTGGNYGRFSGSTAEMKFLDTTVSFNFDNTGEVPATGSSMNLVPQNDTDSGRTGRKFSIKSVFIRAIMSQTAGTESGNSLRFCIVQDTQCNGAAPVWTDVFSTTSSLSHRNLSNVQRFKILKDEWCEINASAGVATAFGQKIKAFKWGKKVNIPIEYSSGNTDGAITGLRTNNIFLLAAAAVGDDTTSFTGVFRIRYSDN